MGIKAERIITSRPALKEIPVKRGFLSFLSFRATPVAYGGSQARDLIGAVAASLCHSNSNAGFGLHLQTILQLTAMLDP